MLRMSLIILCPPPDSTAELKFSLICPALLAAKPPKISLICPQCPAKGAFLGWGGGGNGAEGAIWKMVGDSRRRREKIWEV